MAQKRTIGILGMGKMGEAIIQGLRASPLADRYDVKGTTRSPTSAHEAEARLHVPCSTRNEDLLKCDVIILALKPHQAEAALRTLKFGPQQTLLSICAALRTDQLSLWTAEKPAIVRAMPNTPVLVGQGMTVLCAGPRAKAEHLEEAEKIMSAMGRTAIIEESLMDGATGLSGCGPAFVYMIIESLSEAGVKVGLPRKISTLLAAQTLLGAAKMVLEGGKHPAELKDEVTTPAGCTVDGIMALEEGKLRVTLIKAVCAAAKRSRTLAGK